MARPRKTKKEEVTPFDDPIDLQLESHEEIENADDELSNLFGNIEGKDLRKRPKTEPLKEKPNDVDEESKKLLKGKTRNVSEETIKSMQRTEEVEAELVKTKGRFIEGVDNVQIPKTVKGELSTNVSPEVSPFAYAQQADYSYVSEGIKNISDNGYFDTSDGAASEPKDENTLTSDPRSPNFVGCINNMCAYRDNCLRYRMKNKVKTAFPFFPEECRLNGVYISLDETNFTAYDNFENIDNPVAPSTLGIPE